MSRLTNAIRRHGVTGTARIFLQRAHVRSHLAIVVAMMRRPKHALTWFHDRVARESPAAQGLPWIAMPCVDFLDGYLQPGRRVLEFGGGGSTAYFLNKGCFLTTVESDEGWAQDLRQRVGEIPDAKDRWALRFVPAKDNDDPLIAQYVAQVAEGGPWDVVLVDGWSRIVCLQAAKSRIKPGGILILDNADQEQFRDVPKMMEGWLRREFRGLGVARSWVTQTDVYISP
jgi:predicted O-methyltransferase YrrM